MKYSLTLVAFLALVAAPFGIARAQAPQGLAASALADTSFRWQRDSVAGLRVYFLPGSYAHANRDSLVRRLPDAVNHASRLLGVAPPALPIDVFFVDSREQMRALTGAAVTGFAHTAARAVFIVTNPDWRAFDRHELMHVVAANAWTPIGGRNAWLQEGLAQAADGFCAEYPNADVAAALAQRHGWIDLPTLLQRFREQSDLRAYLQAAALMEYLLRRAGGDAIRPLWTAEVTPETLVAGKSLATWEAEWRSQLRPGPVDPSDLADIEATGCGIRRRPSGTLVIRDAWVIPMTRDTVMRATILVRDGRIVEVGPNVRIPGGAQLVDGRGKYVIPGLADMHTHLFADAATVADSIAPAELGVMLANGVTVARLMIGRPEHLTLRSEIAAGTRRGPMLLVASPHLTNQPDENTLLVRTAAEARAAVRTAKQAGYDFLKVTFVTADLYDAAVDEARAVGLRVAGHVDPAVGVERALRGGAQLEHLDSYFEALLADSAPMKGSVTQFGVFMDSAWRSLDFLDESRIAALAGATARAGAVIGPTQNVFVTAFARGESDSVIRNRPDWDLWPEPRRAGYMRARARYWGAPSRAHRTEERRATYIRVRQQLLRAMRDSGVTIIAGSDTPEWLHTYGWGLHRELASYVEAGLTPFEALRTATANPARYLGQSQEWGTIEPGKRADLILLSANPLQHIENTMRIDAVVAKGTLMSRAELDAMIERGRAAIAAVSAQP